MLVSGDSEMTSLSDEAFLLNFREIEDMLLALCQQYQKLSLDDFSQRDKAVAKEILMILIRDMKR